jgi:hypothetical protein
LDPSNQSIKSPLTHLITDRLKEKISSTENNPQFKNEEINVPEESFSNQEINNSINNYTNKGYSPENFYIKDDEGYISEEELDN